MSAVLRRLPDLEAANRALLSQAPLAPTTDRQPKVIPAVALPKYLADILKANLAALAWDAPFARFDRELSTYIERVLTVMGTLPSAEQRRSLTDDEVRSLLARMDSIRESYRLLRQVATHYAAVKARRELLPYELTHILGPNVDPRPEFRLYDAVRSWLWRRSTNGQQYVNDYDKDEVNIERRASKRKARLAAMSAEDLAAYRAFEAERVRAHRMKRKSEMQAIALVLEEV